MKDLKELFVSYELALKLKEKGFDEPCLAFLWEHKLEIDEDRFGFFTEISLKRGKTKPSDCHANKIALPLYQQVIDWFYGTHDITITYMTWGSTVQTSNGITGLLPINKAIEEALKLI